MSYMFKVQFMFVISCAFLGNCHVGIESGFTVLFRRQENILNFHKQTSSVEPETAQVRVVRSTHEHKLVQVVKSTIPKKVFIILRRNENLYKEIPAGENNCFYGYGTIYLRNTSSRSFLKPRYSWAAITICQKEVEGFLLLQNIGFTLETDKRHTQRTKRNAVSYNIFHLSNGYGKGLFNLTGDTFDFLETSNSVAVEHNNNNFSAPVNLELSTEQNVPYFGSTVTHLVGKPHDDGFRDQLHGARVSSGRNNNIEDKATIDSFKSNFLKQGIRRTDGFNDDETAQFINKHSDHSFERSLLEQTDEDLGYFYDSAWKTVQTKSKSFGSTKNKARFMEIVIGVDDSVIKFHGHLRVKQYVLTLMNIVNALYQDPSLEANVQVVIRDLYFFEKKRNLIKLGNARKSLEHVNHWNRDLHKSYTDVDEPHDIALWLTRTDLGGPSGYAPVGGVCDPERSCALTRDEGLTCAFIIAHELAHVLGLSHDGDVKNNNTCRDEALQGSVMAPMVSATFHHFLWSECSRKEFAHKVSQWQCLLNAPDAKRSIELNATLGARFTMDEQCRAEFGEGYELCRSFDIMEPCAHLWCAHLAAPLVCKTKKSPPLEGTECGPNRWCIDGYCDTTFRVNLDPLKYNSQDGGWSSWSSWTSCSRSCGLGMQFRSRTCDNPKSAYGGQECEGLPEEWRVCNEHSCDDHRDFRAQQCSRMGKLLDVPTNLSWLPYESDDVALKCNYICQSKETGQIYASDEHLIDGTMCSYDWDNKRCVQGKCVTIACDSQVNSTVIEDSCGVCNGNNSQCIRIKSNITKKIRKQITRLGVLHNQARHIVIEFALYDDNPSDMPVQTDFVLFLKDRKRNAFLIHKVPVGEEFEQSRGQAAENNAHPNDVPIWSSQRQDGIISTTIVHGAKFRFHALETTNALMPQNETLYLSTQGPVLTELVLFIEIKNIQARRNMQIRMEMEYLLHKSFKESRYEWIVGGWGSCSMSCGGGKMFKTKACVEKSTQKIVARKLCSIVNKPPTEVRPCNEFSCNFVWIPGQWEPCSSTCGQDGVQQRALFCVPQNLQNNSINLQQEPWKNMLPPIKCALQPPASSRPCNRKPCPGHWAYSEWSTCSTSCDMGEQFRFVECKSKKDLIYPQNELICSSNAIKHSKQMQTCGNEKNHNQVHQDCAVCLGDKSVFCEINLLQRYCVIDSFRELCCHSCQNIR